jgi:hypothetical protein
MENLIQWITENAFNETIALLFFFGGVVLGGILTYVIYTIFSKSKAKVKPASYKKDVTEIKNQAVSEILNSEGGFDKQKLNALLQAINVILTEIPKEYDKKVNFVEILNASDVDFLENSVNVSLDFTAYEMIYFVRFFFEELRREVLKFLNCGHVKFVYGVGKVANAVFIKEEMAKNVEDLKVSQVIEIIRKVKPNPEKEKGVIGKLVGKVFGKVVKKVAPIALNKSADIIEPYLIEVIEIFAEHVNLLYSGNYLTYAEKKELYLQQKESA